MFLYKDLEPALIAVTQSTDIVQLRDWISEDVRTSLQALDYGTYFAIAVFQGLKPSSGHGVQIDQITRSANVVSAYVQFREPTPDEEKWPEMTSPFQIVRVEKAGTWDQDITFNLIVDDVAVATVTSFVP